MGFLRGLDLSHHNGDIDHKAVAATGARFAAVKVTQGANFVDPKAQENIDGFKAAGMVVMPYHYFDPKDSAIDQLTHFENTVGTFKGMMTPALDVELDSGERTMEPADYVRSIMAWRGHFLKHVGRMPVVYSYRDMWTWMGNQNMSGSDLWLADYHSHPTVLRGWKSWFIWQYTDKGSIDGVPGHGSVDLDYFYGTESQLQAAVIR